MFRPTCSKLSSPSFLVLAAWAHLFVRCGCLEVAAHEHVRGGHRQVELERVEHQLLLQGPEGGVSGRQGEQGGAQPQHGDNAVEPAWIDG